MTDVKTEVIVLGMVRLVRMMIQVSPTEEPEPDFYWALSGATIKRGDQPIAGIFADMFVTDESGWQCGMSAIAAVEGWRPPADGEDYDDDECAQLVGALRPYARHVLWDVMSMHARAQCALVEGEIEIPFKTPEETSSSVEDAN